MAAPDPDAPAVLAIDARGVVTLEIVDNEGRVISYLMLRDAQAHGWGVVLLAGTAAHLLTHRRASA